MPVPVIYHLWHHVLLSVVCRLSFVNQTLVARYLSLMALCVSRIINQSIIRHLNSVIPSDLSNLSPSGLPDFWASCVSLRASANGNSLSKLQLPKIPQLILKYGKLSLEPLLTISKKVTQIDTAIRLLSLLEI